MKVVNSSNIGKLLLEQLVSFLQSYENNISFLISVIFFLELPKERIYIIKCWQSSSNPYLFSLLFIFYFLFC